jgi:hypothetical protein
MKKLGINLTNNVEDLYTVKLLLREMKENLNKYVNCFLGMEKQH